MISSVGFLFSINTLKSAHKCHINATQMPPKLGGIFLYFNQKAGEQMYQYYQPNPCGRNTGDCAVRAISKALNTTWAQAHNALCLMSASVCDMPSSNLVWGLLLKDHGFQKRMVPAECMDFCAVKDFIREFPRGLYVLALPGHVVTVKDGVLYDTWDSSNEAVLYYWTKEV